MIHLVGDVDATAEDTLAAAFERAAAAGGGTVVLDFRRADYINSTGIALIVGLLGKARAQDLEVRATGLSEHYREIFEITRLSDFMTIEEGSAGA